MALLVFTEIFFAVALCLFAAIRHRRLNRNAVIATWPVVGMLPGLLKNTWRIHEYATEIVKKSGGTYDIKTSSLFYDTGFILTSDPFNIQYVLQTNFANYPKGDEFRDIFYGLGDGILNVDGDLWKLQRKIFHLWNARQSKYDFVSTTLHRRVMNDLMPFLDHVSRSQIQVDLQQVFQKTITFNNALSLIFGDEIAFKDHFKFSRAEYQQAFGEIQDSIFHRHLIPRSFWKLQRWLQLGSERKYKQHLEMVGEFVHDCLRLRRQVKCQQELDLMSVYLEENEKPYSDEFLKDVAFNFVMASKDTLTASLTWFFWLVATHPFVEEKILDEIGQNLPNENGSFTTEDLNKLVYLQAALNETLRLYPTVPFNHKMAAKDDTLPSGHRVRANKMILISYYSMGRMEEIWGKDCLEFKPERWIDSDGRIVHVAANKYPVFNVGPRTCLGRDIVLVQLKVVAINVIRNYQIRVAEGHPIIPRLSVTLEMKSGLKVNVSKRI